MSRRAATAIAAILLLMGGVSTTHAQSAADCRAAAGSVGRDLTRQSGQMSSQDRFMAEQQLLRARSQCASQPGRTKQGLDQLRRDVTRQAAQPRISPPASRR